MTDSHAAAPVPFHSPVDPDPATRLWLRRWLGLVCLLIFAVVVVGGITRLTESGLSIVDWRPVTGVLPPLTEAEWQLEFAKYQQYPQFRVANATMSLGEFKSIFFWEYLHRLLARSVGLVYLVPFVWFMARGKLRNTVLRRRLWIGFLLGGLQGGLGWFMVKSGLVDMPRVSHLRLAAHLALALFIMSYLYTIWLGLAPARRPRTAPPELETGGRRPGAMAPAAYGLLGVIALQIVYGAFVAGLRAGYGYNTFPTMNGHWLPPEVAAMATGWSALINDNATVQLIHRTLAWLCLAAGAGIYAAILRKRALELRPAATMLMLLLATQFCLGVATLVLVVPIPLASAHQAVACLVLLAAIRLAWAARHPAAWPTPLKRTVAAAGFAAKPAPNAAQ